MAGLAAFRRAVCRAGGDQRPVPLLAGGTLSLGRITSVLFPTFLWLGAVIPASHRSAWLIVFAMLQGLFAAAFFTWRPLY